MDWMRQLLLVSAVVPAVANAQPAPTSNGASAAAAAAPTAVEPAAAPPAGSNPAAPAGESRILPRIEVTSQRYKQDLQEVPMSVTAVSADEIKARNVTTLEGLQYSVPGLSMYEYGLGQEFVQLRGVSNTIGGATVGVYLDETPLTFDLDRQGNGISVRMLDMNRVEVLRGPQATLYGEGSMGGTIRYIPAPPNLSAFGGSVEAKYSHTSGGGPGYEATGVLNIPIIADKLGARLVVGRERLGGFIDNTVTGATDVNAATVDTVRGTVLAQPTDRLTLSVLGLHQSASQNYQDFGINYHTTALVPTYSRDNYTLVQGKAEYEFDLATVTATASHIDRKNAVQADLTSFYLPYLPLFGIAPGTITRISYPSPSTYKVTNAELRVASDKRPFHWSAGVAYRELKFDTASGTETAPGAAPFTLLSASQQVGTKSVAVYGEVGYAITKQLEVTGGVRYLTQRLAQDSETTSFGVATPDSNQATFHTTNPRLNVSYDFSPSSKLYATVAKGFRSGGFNLTSTGGPNSTVPPSYSPDHIWTYEVGTKQQIGQRMFVDASVYRSKWSDVQSYGFAAGSPVVVVTNSGHVAGWGADLSLSARPADGLTLSATYGWNNLAYDRATGDKQVGDPVDSAVRQTWSASLDYRRTIAANVKGFLRVDYQHAGPAQITLRNFNQIVARPSRSLVNLRIGADMGKVEVALFATNLGNNKAPNIIGPFGIYAEDLEQRPRVIGVSTRVDY
jgi:iron complex outermembrane recepter protein